MKALCWQGVNKLAVEHVPDPQILNAQDAIVKVRLSTTCGSDLHLLGGYIPAMRAGDVLGHEFLGEIVEVGPEVRRHKVGDRVVVCSFIGCGRCWYCQHDLWSLCDNGNTNPAITETLWGCEPGGCFGYSHAMGGFAGSHAEYVRVPFADYGAFTVPDGVERLSARCSPPTRRRPAGWARTSAACGPATSSRCGAPAASARWRPARRCCSAPSGSSSSTGSPTGSRWPSGTSAPRRSTTPAPTSAPSCGSAPAAAGPDVCIEAVGMEAHSAGRRSTRYDQVKQQLRLQTDRPTAVREAIYACRKGGSVFVLGVFAGLGRQVPARRGDEQGPDAARRPAARAALHPDAAGADGQAASWRPRTWRPTRCPLDEAPRGYDMFKNKKDGCVRAVFRPGL